MCGIIGIFNNTKQESLVKQGLKLLEYRGKDNQALIKAENACIGHCLHSVVSFVKQPFQKTGILTANCEVYNWNSLTEKHQIKAKNDADLIFQLLEQDYPIKQLIEELDGVFSIAYYQDNTVYLARDLLGVKPVFYSKSNGFAFASERKVLSKLNFDDIRELNPRHILSYNTQTKKLTLEKRPFFKILPENKTDQQNIIQHLKEYLKSAVSKRIPDKKFGILFSGGIDSSLIALLSKNTNKPFTCYTTVLDYPGFKEPEDLLASKKAASSLGLTLKIVKVKLSNIENNLKTIVPLIEDTNVVKVAVALTFFKACEAAHKDGCKVLLSGLGAEELFAGYQRHKNSLKINEECVSGLLKIYERDLYRDDVISMFHSIELRLPFLDKQLCEFALKIPGTLKINNNQEKYILREAAKQLALPSFIAERKKRAAQYGSNMQKALEKLAKQKNQSISQYLNSFGENLNPKLAALISTGKDSIFAMYTMMQQNYPIECLITLKSKNPDSFMFHTPTISLASQQAKSMNIPLIEHSTDGKKEHELKDLKIALELAKKQYNIEGVVTGAILSNYQRKRIEKVCDSLSLKIFSPLWHINQEKYLRDILKNKFKFIITKVAAEGLDKSWLGKVITDKDINNLVSLQKSIGLNPSGEGGEYETLMIDGPIFKNPISIKKQKIIEEDKNTALLKLE